MCHGEYVRQHCELLLWMFRNKIILYINRNFKVLKGLNSGVWAFLSIYFSNTPIAWFLLC